MAHDMPPAKRAKTKEDTPSPLQRHYVEFLHDEGVQHSESEEQGQNDGD
jgi:hypothetical protein